MDPIHVTIAAETGLAYGRGVAKGVVNYANIAKSWSIGLAPFEGVLRLLEVARPKGLIIQSPSRELSRQIADMDIKAVNVADNVTGHCLPTVISDHHAIAASVLDHLMSRGLRHFAFVGRAGQWFSDQREQGFRQAIQAAGLPDALAVYYPNDEEYYLDGLRRMLRQSPMPLGILASDDYWARETIAAALDNGYRVPEDVAVVGVDNDELLCETSRVPLSSVVVAAERIGFEAATLLDRLLKGQAIDPGPYLVPPRSVVVRQSSDVLAIEDQNVAEAVRFISENAHRPIGVEDILEQLTVSRRQIEKRFQIVLGRSPAAEIRRVRIERAKKLMDTTNMPLSRIAQQTGFTDVSFLGKSFRRETGMTPSQYRRRTRPQAG